jgi:Suppressor of fused protein (SUFU)
MFDFFRRKMEGEVSPGGSAILRYDPASWSSGRMRLPEESAAAFAAARHNVYERLFGITERVFEEAPPRVPRIDVRAYYRRGPDGARVCSLVTSGMSDLGMNVPGRLKAPRRVELILYCADPDPGYAETLRWLAHFPHDQRTWVGAGHTIPNGYPPAPFWGSPVLDTMMLMPTVVTRDAALPQELALAGEPVEFLWAVPLTAAECKLKLAKGFGAVLDLFRERRHPQVFDPRRRSYV